MIFECEICNYKTNRSYDLKKHNLTKKHIMQFNIKKGLITYPNIQKTTKTTKSNHKSNHFLVNLCNNSNHSNHCTKKVANIKKKEDNKITTSSKNNIFSSTKNMITEHTKMQNELYVYVCDCGKNFKHKQNLSRHKKTCENCEQSVIISLTKNNILGIKTQLSTLENRVNELELENKMLKLAKFNNCNNDNSVKNTFNTINNVNNTVNENKTFNIFAYICDNFQNVKPVQLLKQEQVEQLLDVDKKWGYPVYRLLIYHYTQHLLDQFIGDIITTSYKKDKLEEQQFWSSDVKKLTFIVRQLLNKNKHVWLRDKQGSYLTECVISPILSEIKQILIRYDKACQTEMEKYETSMDRFDELNNDRSILIKIIKEINIKKLHEKVLAYIAPKFQFEGSEKFEELE